MSAGSKHRSRKRARELGYEFVVPGIHVIRDFRVDPSRTRELGRTDIVEISPMDGTRNVSGQSFKPLRRCSAPDACGAPGALKSATQQRNAIEPLRRAGGDGRAPSVTIQA